jgi:hypothetical protein
MPIVPPIKAPPVPNIKPDRMLSALPADFVRQLNPAARRLLARTPVRWIQTGARSWVPRGGRSVHLARDANAGVRVHEATHILDTRGLGLGRLSRYVTPPQNLATPGQQATFYWPQASPARRAQLVLRFGLDRRQGAGEMLATAAQASYLFQTPMSGMRRFGYQNLGPLTRYFWPTSLGLGGGTRSIREALLRRTHG